MSELLVRQWLDHPYVKLCIFFIFMCLACISILVLRDETALLERKMVYQQESLNQIKVIDSQLSQLPQFLIDKDQLRSTLITTFGKAVGFEIQPQGHGFSIEIMTIKYGDFLSAIYGVEQQGFEVSKFVINKAEQPKHVSVSVTFQLSQEVFD